MKKILLFLSILLFIQGISYSQNTEAGKAYIIYQDAKELYRAKKLQQAKSQFTKVVVEYPSSRYVASSLFMLTFIETDYLKIIEYLNIIRTSYPDFKYWKEAMEKLGDIYYVMGSYDFAAKSYLAAETERSQYMLAVIYSADGKHEEAIATVRSLIDRTKDYRLAYKSLMVMIDSYISLGKLNAALKTLEESIKLRDYAYDGGSRILFYTAKSYFYKKDYARALYVFSLLRTTYPLSSESTLSKNYMEHMEKKGVVVTEPVEWIEINFTRPAELAFKNEEIGMHDFDVEDSAEDRQQEAEKLIGNISSSHIQGYLIRIDEFKDLGVANLVATDLSRSDFSFPIGIYFRDGLYYLEIRGIKEVDKAKQYAKSLMALGYNNTKVIEVVKVTEYER